MRGADGIEAVLLQDTYPSLLALGVSGGSQDAAVVVDATAAQEGLFAVDEKPLIAPFNLADAEGNFHAVSLARCDLRSVETGRLIAPELCVRDCQGYTCPLAADARNLRPDRNRAFDLYNHGVDGYRADLHALRYQTAFFADMQPHGAVDAGAGVPAGVGNPGVVRDHGQRVLRSGIQPLQFHKEACITVGVETKLFAVQTDSHVFIHALEFHKDNLALPLGGSGEGFFIGVDTAGKITVAAIGHVRAALFCDLRIMGQCDGPVVAEPAGVKRNGFHSVSPFVWMISA